MKKTRGLTWIVMLAAVGLIATTAGAASEVERIAELERKVELLSKSAERNQFGDVFSEVGESEYGMGAAASKVYQKEQGVSLGGYGEGLFQAKENAADEADFLRAVVYFGYKYTDRWVFNSEIEFEHASTDKEGSASVEFAYLDYLHSPALNLRAGLVLVPVGLVNELHEPTAFLSAKRSDVESQIIPTTWRENGIGLFGELGETVQYKAFVVNGLKAEDFSGKGLRGGRQKGSKASANDLAGVLRLDVTPTPGLLVGGSLYYGNSGQELDLDVTTEIYEAHLDWRFRGLTLRALAAVAQVDDVAELNRLMAKAGSDDGMTTPADSEIDSIGEQLFGWYVELGYDLLNHVDADEKSLTPFVRFEQYNTQDDIPTGFKRSAKYDVEVVTVGLNFKPLDEIVFKADYQFYDDDANTINDQFNLAMGYVF